MKRLWEILKSFGMVEEEENHLEKADKRSENIFLILSLFMVVLMGILFWNSGVVEGLNTKATNYKRQAIAAADSDTIVAGDILDRNNKPIVTTASVNEASVYADDYAYTQVVGYSGKKTTYYDENGDFKERQLEYRLMEYYDDYKDYLYQNTGIDGTKGCSLTLTLDHGLQVEAARLLNEEVGIDNRGSVVVMNAKTGEILAMVSYPSFNANDLGSSLAALQDVPKEKEMYYPITHKGLETPGSIFKLVTSVALIDHGYENLTVADSDFQIAGKDIVNAYESPNDSITYKEALNRSSNVFFAQAALTVGADAMEETAKKFLIGEELELDFGTVRSNWSLDRSNPASLADTGYGQGDTLLSTIYAAMITQTIANDGVMLKPYLVASVKDEKQKVLVSGATEVLSEVTSKSTADKITNAMLETTLSHLNNLSEEDKMVYKNYSVAGKTGTGEISEEDVYNAWYVSFAPAEDPQYVVVVNQCDTVEYGQDMMDTAAGVYKYLFENGCS